MSRFVSLTPLVFLAGMGSSGAGELPRATPEAVGLSLQVFRGVVDAAIEK